VYELMRHGQVFFGTVAPEADLLIDINHQYTSVQMGGQEPRPEIPDLLMDTN
jgi:hypothetical protein